MDVYEKPDLAMIHDAWLDPQGRIHDCWEQIGRHNFSPIVSAHVQWAETYCRINNLSRNIDRTEMDEADYLEYIGWIRISDRKITRRGSEKGPYADDRCTQVQLDTMFGMMLKGFDIDIEQWEVTV